MRLIRWLLGMVVLGVIALAVFGYALLRASLPQRDGNAPVPGLSAEVKVERDVLGIPTLHAGDRLDLARGLGFVHAQDRFFQMDLLRRAAAGELSELLGPATLDVDRKRRRHRLREVAGQVFARAAADERSLLDAYADGVNAGLRALAARPFEYQLLGAQPQPWLSDDSVLVVFAMYFDLHDEEGERDARLGTLRETLPAALVDFLVPAGTQWDAPLLGAAKVAAPVPLVQVYDLRTLTGVPFPDFVAPVPSAPASGSNNWAVDAARSADGQAWVAGDMHLNFNLPHTWYRARFLIEGAQPLDLTGVTLPGTPAMIMGSNRQIAWSFTNSYGDWTDLVDLKLDPTDPHRYATPDGYTEFEEHIETIKVRGAADESYVVLGTIWGPVLESDPRRPRAIKWLAHEPEASNLRLSWLEQARTVEEAVAVANQAGLPPQNFVVADRSGRIAWTVAGRVPTRSGYDPQLPADWSRGGGWTGWLAAKDYPRIVAPASGRLWTANARTVDGRDLAKLGDGGYALGARAAQIRDALSAPEPFAPGKHLALQLDDRALFLVRWRELLLNLLTPEVVQGQPARALARDYVENWGGRAAVDSVGYRIVAEWRGEVHDAAFAAITAACRAGDPEFRFAPFPQSEGPLWHLVSQRPLHLLNPRHASWEDFLLAALDARLAVYAEQPGGIAARRWGERNRLQMQHPLSRALLWMARFWDMPADELPGDSHMPRVQSARFGASQRMAVSPGHEEQGYFHMPGGQSGHPLSPYYRRGHRAWVTGEPASFLPGPAERRMRLVPAFTEE